MTLSPAARAKLVEVMARAAWKQDTSGSVYPEPTFSRAPRWRTKPYRWVASAQIAALERAGYTIKKEKDSD